MVGKNNTGVGNNNNSLNLRSTALDEILLVAANWGRRKHPGLPVQDMGFNPISLPGRRLLEIAGANILKRNAGSTGNQLVTVAFTSIQALLEM